MMVTSQNGTGPRQAGHGLPDGRSTRPMVVSFRALVDALHAHLKRLRARS